MTLFQKYLLLLLAILVGSVSYYLISATISDGGTNSSLVEDSNYKTTWQSIALPSEYYVRIVHVWWVGVIDWQTELVDPLSGDGRDLFLDQSIYKLGERSPAYMNKGKDIIWLNCRSWYSRKDCWSDSDTEVYLDDDWSCWIQIDKMKIFWRLECIKSS